MKFISETVVASVLLFFLLWFINPFDFWMTDALHMTLLGLVVALFAIFAMFLWKEGAEDERAVLHRFMAARLAYTLAGAMLLVGTVSQALDHNIDPWLPATLALMVCAKIVGRLYAEKKY